MRKAWKVPSQKEAEANGMSRNDSISHYAEPEYVVGNTQIAVLEQVQQELTMGLPAHLSYVRQELDGKPLQRKPAELDAGNVVLHDCQTHLDPSMRLSARESTDRTSASELYGDSIHPSWGPVGPEGDGTEKKDSSHRYT